MLSIIVCNEEGEVLFQNIVEDPEDLTKQFNTEAKISSFLKSIPSVHIDNLVFQIGNTSENPMFRPKLTERQCRVLQCLASSLNSEQTALKLGISEVTVRMHIRDLKKKFHTNSRDQLMAMAGFLGLCDPFKKDNEGD